MTKMKSAGMNKCKVNSNTEIISAGRGHPPSASAVSSASVNCAPVIFFRVAKVSKVPQLTQTRIARMSSQF